MYPMKRFLGNKTSKNITRRQINYLTLGAAALALNPFRLTPAAAEPAGAKAADGQPNIVLVIADDLTWNDMGFMGNRSVKTPNLDRIAAQGVVFDRVYTCTSVCGPTRFQLNTGRMPAFGGIYGNAYNGLKNADPNYATLPEKFQAAGYQAALAGKRHFPDDTLLPAERKFDYEVLVTDQGKIRQAPADFLKQKHDRLFLLYVGSTDPHVVWGRPWPFSGSVTYDPATLILPDYAPDTPAIRQVLAEYYYSVTRLDDTVGIVFDGLKASPHADNTLFLFLTEQGSQIPRGKGTCNEVGVRATMIAHWPGRLEPGRRCEALIHYVDIMPTLLDLVGAPAVKGIDGKSFLPVLMGKSDEFRDEVYGAIDRDRSVGTRKWKYIWTGLTPGQMRMGVYFQPLKAGHALQGPQGASRQSEAYFLSLLEAEKAGAKDPRIPLILDHVRNPSVEELYDLERDPYELNNLLAGPNPPADVLADMRRRLAAWLDGQKDALAGDFKKFVAGKTKDQ